jgi:hypothetical protein
MKKLLFPLFALALVVMASSCTSDSCSLTGLWKVTSADVQSEKLTATIISMAKDELMNTQYEFAKDGSITISRGEFAAATTGTYTYDDAAQTLSWETKTQAGEDSHEASTITACTQSEVTLTQRLPEDPAKELIATVTFTMERIK